MTKLPNPAVIDAAIDRYAPQRAAAKAAVDTPPEAPEEHPRVRGRREARSKWAEIARLTQAGVEVDDDDWRRIVPESDR